MAEIFQGTCYFCGRYTLVAHTDDGENICLGCMAPLPAEEAAEEAVADG